MKHSSMSRTCAGVSLQRCKLQRVNCAAAVANRAPAWNNLSLQGRPTSSVWQPAMQQSCQVYAGDGLSVFRHQAQQTLYGAPALGRA
jgi:hypothetical protein